MKQTSPPLEHGSTAQRPNVPTDLPGPAQRVAEPTLVAPSAGSARPSNRVGVKAGPLKLPKVGDQLLGFELRHELGRGTFARVFLAEQANLAGRPVALKVSAISGDEPQTLAQLQHTHIVPIYSVHEDPEKGLRAVCMPYYGGGSLSAVLQTLFEHNPCPSQGSDFVKALITARSPVVLPTRIVPQEDAPPLVDDGPISFLNRLSYIQTAAWVVLRLAEGIHHAHQRGVLHRDIKPSNVLVCCDGQPMLLDFNVAQEVNSLRTQAKVILGGTVAYMAPEQLQAIARRSLELALKVDRRADLYSLGMVLYEMLAGTKPFDMSGSYSPAGSQLEVMAKERNETIPSLRSCRSDVPWSLESIARKCLAPDPAQRYQYGEELAEDLRRFLADRPLKYAPELSRVERGQKWLRRHPRLTSSAMVAAVAGLLLVGTGAALAAVRQHLTHTQHELQVTQAQEKMRAYKKGTTKALCLVNTIADVRSSHLPEGIKACEDTLGIYSVLDRDDWQDGADWQVLTPAERRRLSEHTRQLLLLLAGARIRVTPQDEATAREALDLLDRAEAIRDLEPSRALWEDRADYLRRLGKVEASEQARARAHALEPASAGEQYLLAAAHVRNARTRDDYLPAIAALTEALRLDDRYYWAWVQRGICHAERGDWTAAAADFGVCVGQWPEFAFGYYNRGYALDRSGAKAMARADYDAALKRDPEFALAYGSRGLLNLEEKRYEAALADLDAAHELGQDDAALHASRGAALEALRRFEEADAAFEAALARGAKAKPEVCTHVRLLYGFTVAKRLPDQARTAFAAVPSHDPRQSQALYGLALIDAEQGRLQEAIKLFDRALEVQPEFREARRFRAILRARVGNVEGASQDINACLDRESGNGATLYAAACVAALAWKQTLDPAVAKQALFFLEKAFGQGYGRDKAAEDPDLAALRENPLFKELLKK